MPQKFMPRSPYAPRHTTYFSSQYARKLRSTKLLRASTRMVKADSWHRRISIHEALTSLDILKLRQNLQRSNFDPRGSCEPRRTTPEQVCKANDFDPRGSCEPRRSQMILSDSTPRFRSTRLLRASTFHRFCAIRLL